jgi:hypothetical protein
MDELVRAIESLKHNVFFDVMALVVSGSTLVISFITLMYSRTIIKKIDRPIVERQLNKLSELIDCLRKTTLSFALVINKPRIIDLTPEVEINFFSVPSYDFPADWLDNEVIFRTTEYVKWKFLEFKNEAFIPSSIGKSIASFTINLNTRSLYSPEDNTKVIVLGGFSPLFPISGFNNEYIRPQENERVILKDFISRVENLRESIELWLEKPEIQLNL